MINFIKIIFVLVFSIFIIGCTETNDKTNKVEKTSDNKEYKIKKILEEIDRVYKINEYNSITISDIDLSKYKTDFVEAIKNYNELSEKEKDSLYYIRHKLDAINENINSINLFENYNQKLELYDIKVGLSTNKELAVFGKIKNNSEKTFEFVMIIIYFLDKDENIIHEMSYPIVMKDPYYDTGNNLLKPNYIKKLGIKAYQVPTEWSQKVKIVISKLREAK